MRTLKPIRTWRWDRIVPWLFAVLFGAFIIGTILQMVIRTLIYVL